MSQVSDQIKVVVSTDSVGQLKIEIDHTDRNHDLQIINQTELQEKVLPLILRADPSIQKRIDRKGAFSWDLRIEDEKIITKRLQHVVPYVCYQKSIEDKLYEYQKTGVKWLLANEQRILADDMGLGKTVQMDCLEKYMENLCL